MIRFEDLREVVLVGHSFAGSVASALAERMPERLRLLVYLDAPPLRAGSPRPCAPPERVEGHRRRAVETSGGATIPPAKPERFGVLDPAQAAWLRPRLTPHPTRGYFDPLDIRGEPGNGLRAAYVICTVICTAPAFSSLRASHAIARGRPDWQLIESATGHDAMATAPEELTATLAALAETGAARPRQLDPVSGS